MAGSKGWTYTYTKGQTVTFNPHFMLTTIAIILIVLWLLGVVTAFTLSGFIHILLVVAIVLVLLRVIRGENPFKG